MNVLGLTISRTKAAGGDLITRLPQRLDSGWMGTIRESFAGAWQRNIEVNRQDALTYGTVFACVSLIASDIAKLWLKLVELDGNGVWTETESSSFSPVLRKPNHFTTRVKFFEHWMISKLTTGNTYVLKERDGRGVVTALYVLDPTRVSVMVAPSGDVFYQLNTDYLSGIQETSITVPAREIIHDVCVPLFHPLVGVSPIFACGLAAMQGLKIQNQSAKFFGKGLSLSGLISTPNPMSMTQMKQVQDFWNANMTGDENAGKIAVMGDGLKFEPMVMTAVNAQLIEQLNWTAENICSVFHVPGYMVGIGPPPPYTDIQSINLQYYSQALQNHIENLEVLLTEGLDLPAKYSVEFDLKALARMDSKTLMEIAVAGVGGGILAPNEARADMDRKPLPGGESAFLQQQYWPLRQLSDRPAPEPPQMAAPQPALPAAADEPKEQDDEKAVDVELLEHAVAEYMRKALAA